MAIKDLGTEQRLALFQAQLKSGQELFRSAMEFGQSAIKLTMLVNGGAAVAMLAFIGSIERASLDSFAAWCLSLALFSFAVGAGGGAFGAIGAYLTQYSFVKEFQTDMLEDFTESNRLSTYGHKLRTTTVIIVCVSASLFLVGILFSIASVHILLSDNGKI